MPTSYFPSPGTNAATGFINGSNQVDCPYECKLSQGSPIYNKNDYGTINNTYNMDDIPGYYCALNSGPPIPHTQRPEGYTTRYFRIWSNNWGTGYGADETTEDEVYQSPQSNFMYSSFNTPQPTCLDEIPPANAPPDTTPVTDPQSSL